MGPKPPDYVIPPSELGVVVYVDRESVGLQFVDPSGATIFLPIPGALLPKLAQSISELVVKMPDVLTWEAPSGG